MSATETTGEVVDRPDTGPAATDEQDSPSILADPDDHDEPSKPAAPAEEDDPGDPEEPRAPSRAHRVARALLPAIVYLSIQQFMVMTLSLLASTKGTSLANALRSWDGYWFQAIAEGGYGGVPTSLVDSFGKRDEYTPLAFFPGFPKLMGLLHQMGLEAIPAGLVVSTVSGIGCAYALTRMGELVRGGSRRVGLVLTALFAATPMSIALSMVYSEALFCAFAAWALVFTLQRDWVPAGVMVAGAGLVRTTSTALVAAFGLAVLVAIIARRDSWRPWLGGLIAPLGLLGYLGFVALETGKLNGWFDLQQRGWDSQFDGGVATALWVVDRLRDGRAILDFVELLVLAATLVLIVLVVVRRVELPLAVYGILVAVMTFGSNGTMASKIRLMVPAFTLLIPVAIGLAKRKTSTVLVSITALTAVCSWYGAYSLVLWGYAI